MKIIAHRRNTIEELRETPTQYGVEIDLRSFGAKLVVHHEPFVDAVEFGLWLDSFRHDTLILNVKEEGLEEKILEEVKRREITDFFFLDQSFPFLVKWAKRGEKRLAVRLSEYEKIDTVLSLAGKVDWVWVDCFTEFPLKSGDAQILQKAGFKLCIVSPELQKRDLEVEIHQMQLNLKRLNVNPEAVCTKRVDLWERWNP